MSIVWTYFVQELVPLTLACNQQRVFKNAEIVVTHYEIVFLRAISGPIKSDRTGLAIDPGRGYYGLPNPRKARNLKYADWRKLRSKIGKKSLR